MSKLRPECVPVDKRKIPDETVVFLVKQAVGQRKGLIHGRLHSNGDHCAMGCFFADHPEAVVSTDLLDEIAAVNDSLPSATPRERWKMVNSWLRYKLRVIVGTKRKRV